MVDLMGYVFLVWFFPVVLQIVLPLCMLAGWFAVQLFNALRRNYGKPVAEGSGPFPLTGVNQKN